MGFIRGSARQLVDPAGRAGRLVPNVRQSLWSRMNEMYDPSRLLSRPDFSVVAARLCNLAAQPPVFLPRPTTPPSDTEDDISDYEMVSGSSLKSAQYEIW